MAETKHTPGPWRWFGNTKHHGLYLATEDRGRVYVMDFVRWGMSGAQPRFQVHRGDLGLMEPASKMVTYEVEYRRDITGIDHPDARLIAAAPELLEALRFVLAHAFEAKWAGDERALDLVEAAIAKAEGRADG